MLDQSIKTLDLFCSAAEETEGMTIQPKKTPIGLDGIPAAETRLSHVDGEKGQLIIAGALVDRLVLTATFESTAARLWSLAGGAAASEAEVRRAFGQARRNAFARLPQLLAPADGLSVIDGFRAAIAALRPESGQSDEQTIVGAMPVVAAALVRRRRGQGAVEPNPDRGHPFATL